MPGIEPQTQRVQRLHKYRNARRRGVFALWFVARGHYAFKPKKRTFSVVVNMRSSLSARTSRSLNVKLYFLLYISLRAYRTKSERAVPYR